MENSIELVPTGTTLSFIDLISNASLLVQLVMAVLVLASLVSWSMIFYKWFTLKYWVQAADEFEGNFWSVGDLSSLYYEWDERSKDSGSIAEVFMEGYRELSRLLTRSNIDRSEIVDGVQRSMRVALNRAEDKVNSNLSFLATVGSTSPYIGLFGTVWGIMNSFRALGTMQTTTIAAVAPGIAEALIATAMGLFAAIPAVIAYNRFSHEADRLLSRYETFTDEFLSIVNRQYAIK
ncbi:MAG: protein TolQ [Acidiferrobacterales bacterium]|nr:protein TolQ [Acidiferrobacterales bacterium]